MRCIAGTDQVADRVLDVHADQRRLRPVDPATGEREVHRTVYMILVTIEPEPAEVGLDLAFSDPLD
jgi:hypothetical protein